MRVMIKPVITEASMNMTKKNWYTFAATVDHNKDFLRELIEKTFKVEVEEIKTSVVKGKSKRSPRSRKTIKQPDWKKVMVKVKEGQKIEIFDQVGA
ncbi:MAG: 50S ribosomal protein L23 [Patescibacteria group bacterium]|jgi:large subunit ribosomal protein L23